MERRKRTRVTVRLQCHVDRPGQASPQSRTMTENISRTGILIHWESGRGVVPAVGDPVVVRLKLPANPIFGQRWMLFDASVVRVTRTPDRAVMIAVTGTPMRFAEHSRKLLDMPAATPYVN